jgi:hypothetical protein
MHFESRFASGPDNICDIFADFIQRTYADDVWVPSDPGAGDFQTLFFHAESKKNPDLTHRWYLT